MPAGPHNDFEVAANSSIFNNHNHSTHHHHPNHIVTKVGKLLLGTCHVGDHLLQIGQLSLQHATPEQVKILIQSAKYIL